MATRTGKRTKAGRRGKKAARGGAAAFAVGLFLAGPQAVAGADTGSDGSAATESGQASSAAQAPARAGVTRSKAAGARTGSPAAEGAGRGAVGRGSAPGRTVAPAAGVRAARAAAAAPVTRAGNKPSGGLSVPRVPVAQVATPVPGGGGAAALVAGSEVGSVPTMAASGRAASARGAAVWSAPALPVPSAEIRPLHDVVQKFFLDFSNMVRGLPSGPVRDFAANLEGALLLLRRTLFRHAPTAGPVQLTSSTAAITGAVNGYDAQGGKLSYEVVSGPALGTVAVDVDGNYRYTPGAAFSGSDEFTVRVTSDGSGINLFHLNLFDLKPANSTEVTIEVGDAAATHPFGAPGSTAPTIGSVAPAALFLLGTPAAVTVTKSGGTLMGTVTLSLPTETSIGWWQNGNIGSMPLADAAALWKKVQAASGDIHFGVEFSGADGLDQALILAKTTAKKDAAGAYVFTGTLLDPNTENGPGIDSIYDQTGEDIQAGYGNFRATYGLDASTFTGVGLTISRVNIFADSHNVTQHAAISEDTTEASAGSITPALSAQSAASAASAGNPISTPSVEGDGSTSENVILLADGEGGYFAGTGQGQVLHYLADGSMLELAGLQWQTPITAMTLFGQYNPTAEFETITLRNEPTKVDVANRVNTGLPSSAYTGYAASGTSSTPSSQTPVAAFDGNISTKYVNYAGPGSGVTIDLGAGRESRVEWLGLTTGNDYPVRDPASYEIYGSVDGTSFTKISSGQLAPPQGRNTAYPDVNFDNPTAYRYYRVVFPTLAGDASTACNQGAQCMQIAEIRLLARAPGNDSAQQSVYDVPVGPPLDLSAAVPETAKGKLLLSGWYVPGSSAEGFDPQSRPVDLYYRFTVDNQGKVTFSDVADLLLADGRYVAPPRPVLYTGQMIESDPATGSSYLKVDFDQTLTSGSLSTSFTYNKLTGNYRTDPGLIVGLGDGRVQMWTPGASFDDKGTWTQLPESGDVGSCSAGSAGGQNCEIQMDTMVTTLTPVKTIYGPQNTLLGGTCVGETVCAPGDGLVAGYDNGQMALWLPGYPDYTVYLNRTGDAPAGYRGEYWGNSSVQSVIPYGTDLNGFPSFVVGLDDGAIKQYRQPNYGSGGEFSELVSQDLGDINRGTTMISAPSDWAGETFIVGQSDGAVVQYATEEGVDLIGRPQLKVQFGKKLDPGWRDGVTAMTNLGSSSFVVGLNNGSIQEWTGDGFTQRQDGGWQSKVNTITPYGSGYVVGLESGAVEYWNGTGWSQLHDTGWQSAVKSAIVTGPDFVVGLENGSIQRWSTDGGDDAGAGGWTEVRAPAGGGAVIDRVIPWTQQYRDYYKFLMGGIPGWEDPTKAALNDLGGFGYLSYAFNKVTTAPSSNEILSAPTYDANGWVSGDPLFGDFAPSCIRDSGCKGSVYSFAVATPVSYWIRDYQFNNRGGATWDSGQGVFSNLADMLRTCNTAGLCASMDAGVTVSGYVIVPDGLWTKLNPANYGIGYNIALTVGPAIRMNLDKTLGSTSFLSVPLGTPKETSFVYEPTTVGVFAIDGVLQGSAGLGLVPKPDVNLEQFKGVAYITYNIGFNSCNEKEAGVCKEGFWVNPLQMGNNGLSSNGTAFGTFAGWSDLAYKDPVTGKWDTNFDSLNLSFSLIYAVKALYGIELPPTGNSFVDGLFSVVKLTPYVGFSNATSISLSAPVLDDPNVVAKIGLTDALSLNFGIDLPSVKTHGIYEECSGGILCKIRQTVKGSVPLLTGTLGWDIDRDRGLTFDDASLSGPYYDAFKAIHGLVS